MCFCSLLTCTEDKGLPRRTESTSEEPMLQKEAARIWQCPQIKTILHLGYKNMHPKWAPLCWHGLALESRDVMPTDRGSTAQVSGCHHLAQQQQKLSFAYWAQTQAAACEPVKFTGKGVTLLMGEIRAAQLSLTLQSAQETPKANVLMHHL